MEYFDIIDQNGNKTGRVASRDEAHRDGLWHKSVHIWFVNSKNEILLQLRSTEKDTNPGCWDISVAGHLQSGDDDIGGAVRETQEEIGLLLEPKDFNFVGNVVQQSRPKPGFVNNEVNSVFVVRKDLDISKLKLQKGEVDELKYVSLEEFKKMIDDPDSKLLKHLKEFDLLLKFLA